LVAPRSPEPVLSPTLQSFGRPARKRVSPVLLPTSHAVSRSLDGGASASPSTRVRRFDSTAAGEVVSRGSSAIARGGTAAAARSLKGAAHGEALVNAPADPVAAKRIEHGNAKAAASLLFDVRKVCCQHIGQSGPRCLHGMRHSLCPSHLCPWRIDAS